jgi:hypothetical protein
MENVLPVATTTYLSIKINFMKSSLLTLSVFISLSLAAQEPITKSSTVKHKWEYTMPFMTRGIGISFQKFDGLNGRIAGFPQYEALEDHSWNLSAGMLHEKNNFISQVTINAGSSLSGHRDQKSSALRNLGAGFDIGYDVIPSPRVMLYPMVGLGGETYQAVFYKDVSAVDFNTVAGSSTVQNNIRSLKFTNSFFTYRLGLGIGFNSPDGHHSIGIQAGYEGSFKDHSWKSEEYQTLANAPSDGLQRFNISLILAGKGMMHMMRK